MRLKMFFAISLLLGVGCELMYNEHTPDKIVFDAGANPDTSIPGLDANTSDAEIPDVGTPDVGIPDTGLSPGLDASQPGLDASSPGLDASEPPDAASPGLDASVPPDAGYPFPATLAVSMSGTPATTLVGGGNFALSVQVEAFGGDAHLARLTFDVQTAGGVQITGVGFYRGATLISSGASRVVTLSSFAGKWVAAFTTEDKVSPGIPIIYRLLVTVSGVVSGNTLKVSLLGDSVPPAGLVGLTGYVYNSGGDSLYSSSDGLCSASGPNFVWTGAASHTPPTPTCSITSFGTPDYADGSLIGDWTIENTLTAP